MTAYGRLALGLTFFFVFCDLVISSPPATSWVQAVARLLSFALAIVLTIATIVAKPKS